MQLQAITTKVAWTICVWTLVSTGAGAKTSAVRENHTHFATASSRPFDGVLRFLAPVPPHHKMTRVARAGRATRLASVRPSHSVTGVHVAVSLPYLHSPYSAPYAAASVPRYPGLPYAYAGPPLYAGYAAAYPPNPYVYRYAYPYPYYVYYAAPWRRWPPGY